MNLPNAGLLALLALDDAAAGRLSKALVALEASVNGTPGILEALGISIPVADLRAALDVRGKRATCHFEGCTSQVCQNGSGKWCGRHRSPKHRHTDTGIPIDLRKSCMGCGAEIIAKSVWHWQTTKVCADCRSKGFRGGVRRSHKKKVPVVAPQTPGAPSPEIQQDTRAPICILRRGACQGCPHDPSRDGLGCGLKKHPEVVSRIAARPRKEA